MLNPWWGESLKLSLSPHVRETSFPSLSWDICFVTSWQWRQLLWKNRKKSQWSWHCKHRHSSSSNNYGFSPERLQFSRRLYKQTGRGKERACKACSLKFQSNRKAPRVINKMAEKTSSLLKRHVSFQSPWHDQRKTGEPLCLSCKVNKLCTNWVPLVWR